jgi:polyphenol oxidase
VTRTSAVAALPVLRIPRLAAVPGVVHGFTRRVPGMGSADGNVGYSPPRDQADAWANRRAWAAAIGVDPDRLVTSGQVHGNAVLRARAGDAGIGSRPGSGKLGLGDALVADEPGPVLFSLHADCLPILMVALGRGGEARAVAAVHAGWRGTVADVAGETVRALGAAFGVRPEDVLAVLGPAIGPCCYPVGDEVETAWFAAVGDRGAGAVVRGRHGAQPAFDLAAANALLLERAGVRADRIERSGECTSCGAGWFSHRGQGPATGRFAAVIALADR